MNIKAECGQWFRRELAEGTRQIGFEVACRKPEASNERLGTKPAVWKDRVSTDLEMGKEDEVVCFCQITIYLSGRRKVRSKNLTTDLTGSQVQS